MMEKKEGERERLRKKVGITQKCKPLWTHNNALNNVSSIATFWCIG